jgi:hypothetical protein
MQTRQFFQGAKIGHLEVEIGNAERPWPRALRSFLAQQGRRRVA